MVNHRSVPCHADLFAINHGQASQGDPLSEAHTAAALVLDAQNTCSLGMRMGSAKGKYSTICMCMKLFQRATFQHITPIRIIT